MSTSSIGSLCIMCSITDTERFSTTQNRKPRPLAKCCETCLSIEVTEGTTVVPEVESQFNIDSKLKSRGWEFQEVEKRRNMGKLGRGVSFSYKKRDNTLSFTPCSGTIRSQVEGAEDQYYRSADPAKVRNFVAYVCGSSFYSWRDYCGRWQAAGNIRLLELLSCRLKRIHQN